MITWSQPPSADDFESAVLGGTVDGDAVVAMILSTARAGDAATAESLLAKADPRLWRAIDAAARRGLAVDAMLGDRLLSGRVTALDLVIAACCRQGYVRELAMVELSSMDSRLAGPILALRAADWVPEIRRRAKGICVERLAADPVAAFAQLGPVAFALENRAEGDWLSSAVDSALADDRVFFAAMENSSHRVRRAAYQKGIGDGRLDIARLNDAALSDPDQGNSRLCAEAAARSARLSGDVEAIRVLLNSRMATVRAEAVYALGEVDTAVDALCDRSAAVRLVAQVVVRRAERDPAEHYRRLLPNPWAVAGLGETGTTADVEILLPCLEEPRVRTRAEAVRALRRLGHTAARTFVALLDDPAPGVVKAAAVALQGNELDEEFRFGLIAPGRSRAVRLAGHRLLRSGDTLARLVADLRLLDDPELGVAARSDLSNCMREMATLYTTPTGARAAELRSLISSTRLDTDTARRLRFYLAL
ncbi:HEAT repeat domain-containing protein [Allokutzneria albata]|uniref:HEAT repeat domain-containing protein n=1 Tax=Allokutzneria albata TaxID=211114 RepID=UPI0006950337|nr:HEAT repeat domain-containing protein [Allokutzneria albata]